MWLWICLILLESYLLVCGSRSQRVPLTLTLWFQDALCPPMPLIALSAPHRTQAGTRTQPRLPLDFRIPAHIYYLQDIWIELNVPIMLYSNNCTNLRLPPLKWMLGLKKTQLGNEKDTQVCQRIFLMLLMIWSWQSRVSRQAIALSVCLLPTRVHSGGTMQALSLPVVITFDLETGSKRKQTEGELSKLWGAE